MSAKEVKSFIPNVDELEEKSRSTDRLLLIKTREELKRKIKDDPKQSDINAFRAITDLLNNFKSEKTTNEPQSFSGYTEVLEYAASRGCRLKKTKLYKDVKIGLLVRQKDGKFLRVDVENYIATLQIAGTSPEKADETWAIHLEKEREKLRKLKLENKRIEFVAAKERGDYIAKEDVYMELAARAITLAIGLKSVFEARIGELVEKLEGNPRRSMEGVAILHEIVDIALNEYSRNMEFEAELTDEI